MQHTLANSFKLEGIGLHSGKEVSCLVEPAPIGSGIMFRRCDVESDFARITPYNVSSTQLATTVDCSGFPISTIEHFSGSFCGLGVDNAYISVSGYELPILDGSAKNIIENILRVGLAPQNAPRKLLKVLKPIALEFEGKMVMIEPNEDENDNSLSVTFELNYPTHLIGIQRFTYKHDSDTFASEIGLARTFGFKQEVEMLHQMGLARGGSLDNAIVIDGDKVLNPEGLRIEKEFVRHKILDLFGDLALIGYPLIGKLTAIKSGHQVNNQFARLVLNSSNKYQIIEDSNISASSMAS